MDEGIKKLNKVMGKKNTAAVSSDSAPTHRKVSKALAIEKE